MASLLRRLTGTRDITTIDDYIAATAGMVGVGYVEQTGVLKTQSVGEGFADYARGGYSGNGVVFSCMDVRQKVFSAPRFRFQRLRDGKASDLYGTPALGLLERPWVGGTTQDLLARCINDADLAGNSFWIRDGRELVRLRPDWVYIAVESRVIAGEVVGQRKLGYVYYEGGKHSGSDGVAFLLDEVAHYMPVPDPLHPYRGMSWLTPIIREIENDHLMSRHKRRHLENGASPNIIITHAQGANRDAILAFDERMKAQNGGVDNAGKTLNLYPGADVKVVGSSLKDLDYKAVQGAGETRVAAAAGVPPVIVGLSEGLEAATYSNYAQARRRFGDGTMHPLWQNLAGTFEVLVPPPDASSRLWYDVSDVPFLREDEADAATIASTQATTIASLITAGYTPDSVVKAIEASDWRLLEHTGLYSVQLTMPGSQTPPAIAAPTPGEDSNVDNAE